MKTIFILTLALSVLAVAAVIQGRKMESNIAEHSASADLQPAQMMAAFRDGMYLGKLAAQGGEARHVSVTRWAAAGDRQAFAAGYEHAYAANLAESVKVQAMDGAFRDGLYLGGLDARQGKGQHVASGRWATGKDRVSFAYGYSRAYREVSLAHLEQERGIEVATR
jgi:hypothetical protein